MKHTLLTICLMLIMPLAVSAQAPRWTESYDAFNQHLLDPNRYIYKEQTSDRAARARFHGAAAIWCQAIYYDMAVNAYNRAVKDGNKILIAKYEKLAKDIYNGERIHYTGFNFDDNNEENGWFIYDDIMWWTCALARGYQTFGNEDYLRFSEQSFCRTWYGSQQVGDEGSYADPQRGMGGGMFWRWFPIKNPKPQKPGDFKSACINFPVAVAATLLYNIVPADRQAPTDSHPTQQTKQFYLEKAKEVYDWAFRHLVDSATGRVADGRHGHRIGWKDHIYNQATFIGAAALLYKATGEKHYLDEACLGADYCINVMAAQNDGLLPFEGGIEQGIYVAIWAQYMQVLIEECGQTQYLPFIADNIDRGWANRDSRQLCAGDYRYKLREGTDLDSYSASAIPALMTIFDK